MCFAFSPTLEESIAFLAFTFAESAACFKSAPTASEASFTFSFVSSLQESNVVAIAIPKNIFFMVEFIYENKVTKLMPNESEIFFAKK